MRDISEKTNTLRKACARAIVRLSPDLIAAIKNNEAPKGDPLGISRIAAIQAAKNTSQIIPYCHPVPIDFVGVEFQLDDQSITIEVEVKAIYKTGVEMEALTAASVAALTIYDMLKPLDNSMQIETITLLSKEGGKSSRTKSLTDIRCGVVVISDSVASGKNDDKSGQAICQHLQSEGLTVSEFQIISDNELLIVQTISKLCDQDKLDLIITTGGTGLGHRDNTPEALKKLIETDIPGIAETMRNYGQNRNSFAMLSRSQAGLRDQSLIVSLPGSVSGVQESLHAIFPAILHIFSVRAGTKHDNSVEELVKK